MTSPKLQRVEVRYHGHVQGVGFRFTVMEISRDWKIGGYVRNLDDGSVEVVAEGTRPELEGFLSAISKSRLGNLVSGTNDCWTAPQGVFDRFQIDY